MSSALIALEAQVHGDLAKTAHPNAAWLTPKPGPDGRPALDVLVVGAGQSGLATAFGLLRSQVSNILVLDKSDEGQEGPWLTYARMHTLRSPKHFTGPDLDIPSLGRSAYISVSLGLNLRHKGSNHWALTLWRQILCNIFLHTPNGVGRNQASVDFRPSQQFTRKFFERQLPRLVRLRLTVDPHKFFERHKITRSSDIGDRP